MPSPTTAHKCAWSSVAGVTDRRGPEMYTTRHFKTTGWPISISPSATHCSQWFLSNLHNVPESPQKQVWRPKTQCMRRMFMPAGVTFSLLLWRHLVCGPLPRCPHSASFQVVPQPTQVYPQDVLSTIFWSSWQYCCGPLMRGWSVAS